MSVLTNWPAVPNRIAIGCEYLQSAGKSGVTKAVFEKHLSPLGTKAKDEDGESTGKPVARDIFNELVLLRLAVDTGEDRYVLSEDLPEKPMSARDWGTFLLPRLREILVNDQLAAEHGQKDVPETLAWLLAQSALRPLRLKGDHAVLLDKQFPPGKRGQLNFTSDQTFQNLVYWAEYLGFAEIQDVGYEMVIPDPTRAIKSELVLLFGGDNEISVSTLLERLSARMPILELGKTRLELEQRMLPEYGRETPTFLSTGTSLALRRLELLGVLSVGMNSDYPEVWVRMDGAGKTSTITHVLLKTSGK